jgi:HJR/Mrr/RecB family endonuclease
MKFVGGSHSGADAVPSMSPIEYERFVGRLLQRAGWTVKQCGRAGDQGCDVVAELRGLRAVVQCKLYRGKRCGNAAVQQIVAARRHYGAHLMVVVCPAGFTPAAQALAASNGVHLMDHAGLVGLERAARIPAPAEDR